MKTKTHIPALFLIISLMFASSTFALNKSIDFEEETYIDDIPFNTEWIVNELMTLSVDFEEEAYVDDIPFNTAEIVAKYNYTVSVSVSYELAEESYINDIPFNTNWVADEANARLVQFEEEAYVDDIPFNTYAIASESSKLDGVNIVAINK